MSSCARALNAGKPILNARCDWLPELFVEEYKNGANFDPENEAKFVRITQKASQDCVWREILARGAPASGTKLSDFENRINQYEFVYREAVKLITADGFSGV